VLVIGPNRVFLRYIEQVLPSLGEAGVEQVVLADLVPGHRIGVIDTNAAKRVKGDIRMAKVIAKAVQDRQRPVRDDVEIPYGAGYMRLRATESARIVRDARRRFRRHNAAHRFVETEVISAMIASSRNPDASVDTMRDSLRDIPEFRATLARMWPMLVPAELLHDLFGSAALVKSAAKDEFSAEEYECLVRERSNSVAEVLWSDSDVALLDEALALLGPRPRKNGKIDETDEVRVFGHIVIDEVQDLTPMQLRMASRRSLSGAMTVVGDLAQATGPFAPNDWSDLLQYLPAKREQEVIGLSVGYRIPAQIMSLADKVMLEAAPSLRAPKSVREGDFGPDIVAVKNSNDLLDAVIEQAKILLTNVGEGNVAIVCPDDMTDAVDSALSSGGVAHGRANTTALDSRLTVVPVSVVKGLELDGVLVVEPARIVASQVHGLRALYVALTRSTQRLTIVHSEPLPRSMQS
jgi:DNA helicase IV